MLAKLETLPWLVLSRICDFLDDDDDYDTYASDQRRSDLRAFSLTSRQCCAATASQRFFQVRVAVTNADDLMRSLERWTEMLDRDGGRFCYVQRLKVILSGQDKVGDEWEERRYGPWFSDVPCFRRPSELDYRGPWGLQSITDEHWLALARFIGQLPALKDLVWGFVKMPQPVLAAIHAAGTCRLHMQRFCLCSLVAPRNGDPQVVDIDPDDYALATSPALFSVVAELCGFRSDGELDYNEDAVLGMVAGTAPNLQHVWLIPSPAGNSLALMAAAALGKPPASPNSFFSPKVQVGNLRSLIFTQGSFDINVWATRADFSKLCHLALDWDPALADIAARGELASLRELCLEGIDLDSNSAVCQLLTALNSNSLRGLSLSGHIHEALFDTVLDRHGQSLRHLFLKPFPEYDEDEYVEHPPPPPVFLTPALSARLVEKCPNLEQAEFSVDRSLGDARECAVYRGLSRLPRLRRLSLRLWFIVSPNEVVLDENRESNPEPEEIPRAYLSQAFANAAVDAGLACAIFDMLSPSGGLQHLRLLTWRKRSPYVLGSGQFDLLLAWLGRNWICERRKSGDNMAVVETREISSPRTLKIAAKEWQSIAEASKHYWGEQVFIEAFGDVWLQTTPRWWEDWKSIPLCPDGGDTE
jgi:hypothetical protein